MVWWRTNIDKYQVCALIVEFQIENQWRSILQHDAPGINISIQQIKREARIDWKTARDIS